MPACEASAWAETTMAMRRLDGRWRGGPGFLSKTDDRADGDNQSGAQGQVGGHAGQADRRNESAQGARTGVTPRDAAMSWLRSQLGGSSWMKAARSASIRSFDRPTKAGVKKRASGVCTR